MNQPMSNKLSKLRPIVAFGLAALLVACSKQDPQALVASARQYLDKQDYPAAVIQLKNALDADGSLAEARFMLGTALLQQRDSVGAELEFRKAAAAGYPKEALLPRLARALLEQGKLKDLLSEFADVKIDSPPAQAALKTVIAAGYAANRDPDRAQAAINAALEAAPGDTDALLMQARIQVMRSDIDGALKTTDQAIAQAPHPRNALALKGDLLLYGKQQPVQALAVYQKLVETDPKSIPGYSGMLAVLLGQSELEQSAALIKSLQKFAPDDPNTRYFEAQLAYQKGDYKGARDILQLLLKYAPNNPRLLQLAGAVEYQAKAYVQAAAMLSKALQEAPQLDFARRMLVATHLAAGSPQRALETLPPNFSDRSSDAELLALAGQAYLQNGDSKRAEGLLARAAQLDPTSGSKRTSLALARLYGGKGEQALVELRDIARTEDGADADAQLVGLYLRRGEVDKARAAAERLEQRLPNQAMPRYLHGTVHLAGKDVAAARVSFEKALTLNPEFFPAAAALAQLDLADKKPEAARARFEAILKRDPKQMSALLALAETRARAGAGLDEVVSLLNTAVRASPNEPAPRRVLIDYYLRNNQPRLALTAAQTAVTDLPQRPELLDMLGQSQQAAGETNQAIATFKKLGSLVPDSPSPLLRLGNAYLADKQPELAQQAWRQALQIQPNDLDAQRALIRYHLQTGHRQEALAIAQTIQTQRPNEAAGWLIDGEIRGAGGDWASSIAAFRRALKIAPDSVTASRLHVALISGGRLSEAATFVDQWTREHPTDSQFYGHLGNVALARKNAAAAEKQYRESLTQTPGVPWLLNNLAWALIEQKNTAALEPAREADRLAPNQPPFLDTLAAAQSLNGEHAKAIETQKKAIALSINAPAYRTNLAKLYLAAGDKAKARTELDGVLAGGDRFNGRDEATKLRAGL